MWHTRDRGTVAAARSAHPIHPTVRSLAGGLALGLTAGCGALLAGCSSSGSDAAADVRVTSCVRDADNHRAVVRGEVHNGSSKRSNYVIQIDVKANDSKIESGLASVFRVRSGATDSFTVRPVGVDVPSGTTLTCTVAHVGRIAAE
ncbi:conserved hypothetical protein [Frankia canadensis]|uniref:Uncharacterized protein n=1 Tax=Frankia canadensis TaxID=1836972 RepID=A0A2I2KT32_9ACTN|nr:hypothetical protein [Frankia canadensis]SNQ48799.1 conserved hypothetical protein [Frankia canadensis]SOU56089.1 conserved hypothetical protein [Frankia canadensis]